MLSADKFQLWLRQMMRFRGWTILDVAELVGVHERRVRAILGNERVCELSVERFGIALAGDPRLAAQLYPELDFDPTPTS
jgi:hypothetical protein